jgi:hypothetical protein
MSIEKPYHPTPEEVLAAEHTMNEKQHFTSSRRNRDVKKMEKLVGRAPDTKEEYQAWLEDYQDKLLKEEQINDYIAESQIAGEGLFAKREFEAGDLISEYVIGKYEKYYTEDEIEPDSDIANNGVQAGIDKDGNFLYVGVPRKHPRNFVNHSCEPNAGLSIIDLPDGVRNSRLVAIRPIKKDEEITIDYGTTQFEEWETEGCNCGSPNCRGHITNFQKLPKETQEKYIHLGIVPKWALDFLRRGDEWAEGEQFIPGRFGVGKPPGAIGRDFGDDIENF